MKQLIDLHLGTFQFTQMKAVRLVDKLLQDL